MKNVVFSILFVTGISSAMAQTTGTTKTHTSSLPFVSLGANETAEIDVVNVAANSSSGTAASCTGTISFLSPTGTTLGTATNFTALASGGVSSAKLSYTQAGATSGRALIRGTVSLTLPASSSTTNPPCSLELTMAIYDSTTGATHAIVGGSGPQYGGGGFGRP